MMMQELPDNDPRFNVFKSDPSLALQVTVRATDDGMVGDIRVNGELTCDLTPSLLLSLFTSIMETVTESHTAHHMLVDGRAEIEHILGEE